jgi:Ser/Thr protein kinase RdoA (MazF antagonist)
VRDAGSLYKAFQAVCDDVVTSRSWCVIHGDTHPGNVFLDGTGRPSLLDWQLVQRGPWYIDVGYHLASVLTVADRRRSETDLVRHYLDRLAVDGIDLQLNEQVWQGLRRGMIHGYYLWGITLKVDPRKTAVLLERLGTAVADHDAFREVTA